MVKTSSAGDVGLIPGLGIKIPHATQHGKLGSPQVLIGVAKKLKKNGYVSMCN